MTYKEEQERTRQLLKARTIVHQGQTLDLGIGRFKKANPGRSDMHRIYKENAWKTRKEGKV